MGELGPPNEGPTSDGGSDLRSVALPSRPADTSRAVSLWLARWRDRLVGERLPEDEARLVIEAVLEELGGGAGEALEGAGRAWGRAHRSVTVMVGHLSSLREAMIVGGVDHPLVMHRALDRVTASATEEVLKRFERASRTDALTGAGNRRAFDETLSAALSAAARQSHEVTVVAVDLDGLKRVNDTEGHAAGDAALLALVRAFYAALRDEDSVFRVGGDEFVILLPFTSVSAAESLVERVQSGGAPSFTWGAAGYPDDGLDARGLVEVADRNLYRRRHDERRRVAVPALALAPSPGAGRLDFRLAGLRPSWRWAWVPAAAVLLISLVATLVSGPSLPAVSAQGKGRHVVAPSRSGGPPSAPGAPPVSAASGATAGAGPMLTTRYVAVPGPAVGSPPGQRAGQPSPVPGGTPAPTGSSPASDNGGVLGTLESDLSALPLVGGNDGLIADVGQALTGGSPSTVTTGAPEPVPAASVASDRLEVDGSSGGLLSALSG